jgi:hypothetical protein
MTGGDRGWTRRARSHSFNFIDDCTKRCQAVAGASGCDFGRLSWRVTLFAHAQQLKGRKCDHLRGRAESKLIRLHIA